MAKKIKIQDDWDQLTKDACMASNLGISYGKYKAGQYVAEERIAPRKVKNVLLKCEWCSSYFDQHDPEQKFCCKRCQQAAFEARLAYLRQQA